MKKYLTISLISLVLVFSVTLAARSYAQPQESAQETDFSLSARCGIAQQKLSGPVRQRDLRTRVDRMQAYLYIYERLDIFTKRLENNNQPYALQMRTLSSELNTLTSRFKSNYEAYDSIRTKTAAAKDCGNNTEQFTQNLELTRSARKKVNEDVVAINTLLSGPVTTTMNDLLTELSAGDMPGVPND